MTTAAANSQDVKMAPRRLGHANLFVGELQRSMHFYNKVCGLEIVRLEPEIEAGFLTAGATHHDVGLMQASNKPRVGLGGHVQIPTGRGSAAGLNHFGWEMENEAQLVAAFRRARDLGLKIHRTTDHQISHSVYLFDPDGNLNEFYADAVEDWRTIFNLEREELVSGHWDPDAAEPSTKSNYLAEPVIRQVEGAVFNPIRITHAIMVADKFDEMREFYTRTAGLTPIEESEGKYVTMRAAAGEFDLALVPKRPGLSPGLLLIAFRLSEHNDIDRCEAALRKAGVVIDRVVNVPGKRGIVINDPDGIVIELYQPTESYRPLTMVNVEPYIS